MSSCERAAACHRGYSAVDEHEALAKLVKGRTGHALGVSSNVCSYKYSRLPDSVADAPPLLEMLPAEARFLVEEFQLRMLLPPVAAVIQEVRGNLDATTICDCPAVLGRMLALSVRR